MSTNEQFLQAIVDDPENDLPRLIYADWLDEQGDPRGEFIRVQCELARLDEFDPDRLPLIERQDRLLKKHKATWTKDRKIAGVLVYEFHRGFIETVTLNAKNNLQNADALLDAIPTIRRVKVNSIKPVIDDFIRSEWLQRIDSLDLSRNQLGGRSTQKFLESPNLGNLRELELSHNNIPASGFMALVESDKLPRLKSLVCREAELTNLQSLAEIARGPLWLQLESIELCQQFWNDDAIQTLAENWPVCGWKRLNLGYNRFGERGLLSLLENGHLTSLEWLHVGACDQISDPPIIRLAESAELSGLETLNLNGCNIHEAGLQAVLNSQTLSQLRTLFISSNLMPEIVLPIVASSTGLPKLQQLYLNTEEDIQWDDLDSLREPNRLQQLQSLVIPWYAREDHVIDEIRCLLPNVKITLHNLF